MNIIETLALRKLPYYFDFGQDEVNNYDIVNLIKSISEIKEFYGSTNYNINDIDSYINYLLIEHLDTIDISIVKSEYREDIERIKPIISEIKNKFCHTEVLDFIKKNYEKIFSYYSKEEFGSERNSINIHIRLELRKSTIREVYQFLNNTKIQTDIVEYLINNDVILFFDSINYFNNYHNLFIENLEKKEIIEKLINFRYTYLLEFLERNIIKFRQSLGYDKIIENLIENIENEEKHIYQREKECKNLIYFLKQIKETKARSVEKIHNRLIDNVNEEIKRTGHKFEQEINIKDVILEYKRLLQKKDINDFTKLIYPMVINKNSRYYMLIENINKIDVGLTAIFEQDQYYCSVRIMYVEQFIIPSFNNFLFNYAIKNIGYRRLEKLIIRLINQVFSALLIEYDEKEIMKDVKGIVYSLKNCYKKYHTKAERNYMYYIHSTYVISYIEKILRKLYVSVYEREVYIDDNKITLGSIFKEKDKTKLNLLIGENLLKWIRYFIFSIDGNNKFDDKIGYAYRNRMCHYRDILAIDDLSNKIYYDVIFLFFNLIIALHFNICNYPCEETEKIIIEQLEKIK